MKRLSSLLLLIIFSAYYSSTVLFLHTHRVHGVVVVHSHFYLTDEGEGNPQSQPQPQSRHHHSAAEFSLIHALSFWNSEQVFSAPGLPDPYPLQLPVLAPPSDHLCAVTETSSLFLRGPPRA